jgi:hypothetical protein
MLSSFSAALVVLAALATRTAAKNCASGAAACVAYGPACGDLTEQYTPTCEGNCFQYNSFGAIQVQGNIIKGTDCHVYSDSNCQNQILDTGNQVLTGSCHTLSQPGQSMKCYFNC